MLATRMRMASGGGESNQTLLQMIQSIGADANLVLCLDAADSASYDGTSQTWTDVSGSGNNFFRGTDATSEATDPTFNGTSGGLSANEYFSAAGDDDKFRASGTPTFAETWHKDNAAFTIALVTYFASQPTASIGTKWFATGLVSTDVGVVFDTLQSSSALRCGVINGSGTAMNTGATTATMNTSAWNFTAVALDEATGANGCTIDVNGTKQSFTSTYTSPSTGGSTDPYEIWAYTAGVGGHAGPPDGTRIGCIAMWSRRLSDTELTNLRTKLLARYTGI